MPLKPASGIGSFKRLAMNKKATDRIINAWVLTYLFGPSSLLSLSAFVIGYGWPGMVDVVQPIAEWLGLHHIVESRILGADFGSAAYLYWATFWITFPLSLVWLHLAGVRQGLLSALRSVALANLSSGAWDPQKYTLRGGYARVSGWTALTVSVFVVQVFTAAEPSSCKGCESSSVLGFVLINWGGVHMMLVGSYIAGSYLVLWKSVHRSFFGARK